MMKNSIKYLSILFFVSIFMSCSDAEEIIDTMKGNEYYIEIDGVEYEKGQSLFAGITTTVSNEDDMQAGISPLLTILFEKSNYSVGNVLVLDYNDTEPIVASSGALVYNKDTDNVDVFFYVALSGTVTIVSEKRIEFNLTCYRLSDLDLDGIVQGAIPFVVSGYVTENNPD